MNFFIQILANSLVTGTQVLLFAVSLYLIRAVSKTEHVALGAIATFIAYMFYVMFLATGSFIASSVFALLWAVIFGYTSFALLEKFYKNNDVLLGLLASLSFGIFLESLIGIIFETDAKNIIDGVLPVIDFGLFRMTTPGVITVGFGILLTLIVSFVVLKTPYGRVLRSINENNALVSSLGVNSAFVRSFVYCLGCILTGFVGVMIGLNSALTPFMGFQLVITGFIALFVGGVNDIRGVVVATFLLSLIPEFLINYSPRSLDFSASHKMFFVFLIALILVMYRPNGLFSKNIRKS
jgi:branched-chain amino acid transport system permease protein